MANRPRVRVQPTLHRIALGEQPILHLTPLGKNLQPWPKGHATRTTFNFQLLTFNLYYLTFII
ncbi:hypothetical protein [Moorena sp. SIO4G3]|uniref:hypothetical protein n=1 Tax=Moorena sp. SIO4G3 TaxID=2607821 RepID=UPI00142B97A8|nr:hypothetical protein [Moorena sp. SIO4G3]NEO80452.1 hypothetical protein [Moorena sp. SIO4G3]